MATALIVTIPSGDPDLQRAIEQGLEPYADVRQAQSYGDLETVKLVLEIVGQGVAIAGGVAGILAFLRSVQHDKAQQGEQVHITIAMPGAPPVPIEAADAALLARLLANQPQ